MPIDPSNITPFNGPLGAFTNNWTDSNYNEICSGAKSSFSTNAATNHNYKGGGTPNFVISCVTGTATATAFGTFTATQYTPAETTPAATTAYTMLI